MVAKLRELREARFITQAELSEMTGIAESNISRLENGIQSARISTIRKLAKALGVQPKDLIGPDDEKGKAAG